MDSLFVQFFFFPYKINLFEIALNSNLICVWVLGSSL